MKRSTLAKVAALVIGLPLLVIGCGVLAAVNSLRDPPFDPPELAPLGRTSKFRADRVLESEAGYLVAGVVGTSDPLRGRPCSGRVAVVFLDVDGHGVRASVPAAFERGRYCAERIEAVVAMPDGGWLVTATGSRDSGPSALFPSKPSTDSQHVTLRLDTAGSLVETFGDGGVVTEHRAAGRVDGAVFTTKLERMTEDGSVHDDLVDSDAVHWGWPRFEADADLIVALDFGPAVSFQTFERDSPSSAVYRPLHPDPIDSGTATVDLGEVSNGDTAMHDGTLYVVIRDAVGTRINAVDPRRLRVNFGFNGTGAVRLRSFGYVSSAELIVDEAGRVVVAVSAIEPGSPGRFLHVLRLGADGEVDESFGGAVSRAGRALVLDSDVKDALVDRSGRTVVLADSPILVDDEGASLIRLDGTGALDLAFGSEGIVDVRRLRPCELPPARDSELCRFS